MDLIKILLSWPGPVYLDMSAVFGFSFTQKLKCSLRSNFAPFTCLLTEKAVHSSAFPIILVSTYVNVFEMVVLYTSVTLTSNPESQSV